MGLLSYCRVEGLLGVALKEEAGCWACSSPHPSCLSLALSALCVLAAIVRAAALLPYFLLGASGCGLENL